MAPTEKVPKITSQCGETVFLHFVKNWTLQSSHSLKTRRQGQIRFRTKDHDYMYCSAIVSRPTATLKRRCVSWEMNLYFKENTSLSGHIGTWVIDKSAEKYFNLWKALTQQFIHSTSYVIAPKSGIFFVDGGIKTTQEYWAVKYQHSLSGCFIIHVHNWLLCKTHNFK